MIALLVVTDGRRDYLIRTIESARKHLPTFAEQWMFDDTGDDGHRDWLAFQFPEFIHINAGERQGFGGAVKYAWERLAVQSHCKWIFHLEQDFTFNRDIDVDAMCQVLDKQSHLQQMALRRQPCNREEFIAGGVVEANPLAYEDCTDERHQWLEHRQFFSTNPCVYRRSLCALGWPDGERSEAAFSAVVLEDITHRCAYWGARSEPPAVHHIGDVRTGTGY